MGTGYDVGDDLSFGRIWNRRLQHADDSGFACSHGTEPDNLSEHRRVAFEHAGPEAMSQNHGSCGGGTIVPHIEQPPQYRPQTHHVEIGPANYSGAHLARFAKAMHGEADRGELAECAEGFRPLPQIEQFGYGEGDVLGSQARRALPDVYELVLIAIYERSKKNAPDQSEDRGICADPERQRQDDGQRKTFCGSQRPDRILQIAFERFRRNRAD